MTPYKNRLVLCIVVFMLFFALSAQAAQYLTVAKDGVNVRRGPSTNEEIVMELFEGWPLKVTQKKGDWYQVVDYENDKGWIYKTLVKSNNSVIVNVKKTGNMRSGPSKTSPVIAEVERGVVLERLSTNKSGWVKVKHSQGTVGYIFKSLLWPQS